MIDTLDIRDFFVLCLIVTLVMRALFCFVFDYYISNARSFCFVFNCYLSNTHLFCLCLIVALVMRRFLFCIFLLRFSITLLYLIDSLVTHPFFLCV